MLAKTTHPGLHRHEEQHLEAGRAAKAIEPIGEQRVFMTVPLVYDLTRLATRLVSPTPNGIDRVDMAFARHVFARSASQGLVLTPLGLRIVEADAAERLVSAIKTGWGEVDAADEESVMAALSDFLDAAAPPRPVAFPAVLRLRARRKFRPGRIGDVLSALVLPGPAPIPAVPKSAVYLNVSQFPLWVPAYFGWLRERPDVSIVPFIHDLIPLEYPEYFRKGEYERHRRRLQFVAERASAAIVATQLTKQKLLAHLATAGRSDLPVRVAGLPVDPVFFGNDVQPEPKLRTHPYFIVTGTIEPRKNHLLLLQIWRRMVQEIGQAAPKLVLVGRRGWENENVVDLLERSHGLRNHVVEVSGLSSGSVRRLMIGARAMLLPTFSEGYGLPLIEAQATGTPVIASDIPIFREIGGPATFIDPMDGSSWMKAILKLASPMPSPVREAPIAITPSHYFAGIDSFLERIAARKH